MGDSLSHLDDLLSIYRMLTESSNKARSELKLYRFPLRYLIPKSFRYFQ